MGLIQNKVTVSQPNSHVVVKNAGGLRGLTGETGPQGPQGVPGQAATVTAGTTTTLPAGSDATVQNVGSTSAAIFNFGIPKGDKGDTGETGAAATISVGTTTTLDPGEDATVTNSGTSSAAVFDFGIPKGAKGDTGSQGPAGQDGADGFSPTATVTKTGDTATITITDKDGTTTAQISDGVTPTIDPALSPTSENPVQNKVVTNALAGKADKPIVVSSLPATGTAGQEYFVDDRYNTVTELKGDTQQTTYSGKNLYINSQDFGGSNWNNSASWTTDSSTYNGLVVKTRSSAWQGISQTLSVESGKTYTFSLFVKAGSARAAGLYLNHYESGAATITPTSTSISVTTEWQRYSVTFSVTSGGTVRPRLELFEGFDTPVYICGYQLEQNSSMTSYEPYVGGMASPNPDYPQAVQTVTGEQTITVSNGQGESQVYPINLGKNLFDKDNFPSIDGFIRADNYTLTSSASNKTTYIKVSPNTTYTFSGFALGVALVVGTFNGVPALGDVANVRVLKGASDTTVSITTGASDSYIAFMYKTSSDTLDTSAFQIEKGSAATTYAPYIQAFGKNLFNKDNANTIGAFITSGTPHTVSADANNSLVYIPCQPNTTYTISKIADNVFRAGTTDQVPANGVTVNGYTDNATGTSITLTTSSNAKYIAIFVRNLYSTNTLTEILASLQIEKGSSATTYEPNMSGQLELCEIGDYQNVIFKNVPSSSYYSSALDDGAWYVHKDLSKIVIDGSRSVTSYGTATTGKNRYSVPATGAANVAADVVVNVSDKFVGVTRGDTYSNVNGIYQATGLVGFYWDAISAYTTAQVQTWLSANNITAYYPLANPTDTKITYEPLVAQLEALAGAKIMVDGGTATVTSQYLPATLTTAYNSNSGYIDYIYDGTNFVKVR